MTRGGGVTGVPTGFRDLDDLTGGLQPSDLIILAGRPAMGKTAFALNMAIQTAIPDERDVRAGQFLPRRFFFPGNVQGTAYTASALCSGAD